MARPGARTTVARTRNADAVENLDHPRGVTPLAGLWDAVGAGWACTDGGPWTDPAVLTGAAPAASDEWRTAREILNSYDPARVFSSTFLDTLLP
ncbi:cholesterol oxidase substrate-binding domain-containing protein [Streptomyces platensis]|uniref:cholesterol oxidase substrate-binding domain-containing protein n=1 Tax=Streptomyces platensis TaxID=58346 RepID=UPI0036A3F78A